MKRRSFLAGASALALLTATRNVVGATLSTFPGDTPGWAAVFGLKTMTQAIYQASFSTLQPCLDYEARDIDGNVVSSGTISFNNGKLDVAAITAAQEGGGIITDLLGVPIPYCSSRQLFVSKWYDQSGARNHVTQATQANMPVLAVIDGEPHLIFGQGVYLGASSAALSFRVANVTVAVCCQPYVTGSGGQYNNGNGTLFSLSSPGDSQALVLGVPASVTTAYQTNTSLGANWLIGNDALGLRAPSAPFRVNKTSVTMSSGAGGIEVGASNEIFSTPNNPFAPYPNVSGTGIVIGVNFLGYIDAFMVKAGADTPAQTASCRSALDSAFGVNVDENYNVVIEGDFSSWGFGGLFPFIPESAQGRQGYGLTQFYMARLAKNARFNAVGTNGASWSDYGLRTAVIRNLYRQGATKNVAILQNASGGVTDPSTYTAALLTWVSMLGGGWMVIVVDLPDLSGNPTIRAINVAARAAAAQGGYICVPSLTPSSWQNALKRYKSEQLLGTGMYAGNLSPVGYSVLAAAEIPGINAALTVSSLFPGDPLLGQSWAAVYGLKPMTKAIYDASFDIPQPCLEYVTFDADGTQSNPVKIYIKSGNLDVAAILDAQGPFLGTDGKPVPYCASNQLFVTKWYDQSGGQNDVMPVAQVVPANIPGLAVIDGEPHLLLGIGTVLGARDAALSFSVTSVTVAACCQPYVTGTGGTLPGNEWDPGSGVLFGLSSIDDDRYSIKLGGPASVSTAHPHTPPDGANWLIANTALELAMPSAKFRLNKTSVTLSSGTNAIEVGAGDDVSKQDSPFAPYTSVSGNGIVIGRNFMGYLDAFMVKSGADIPDTTKQHRVALDCAYGVKVDESFNFVIEGDSSGWGYDGIFPYVPGSNQGQLGYGFSQFYMAALCKHGRLNNIGTSNAQWPDYKLRTAVVRDLYRPGATNVVILHNDGVKDGNGTPYTPQSYLNNLTDWISQLGAGWTILVVDIPEIVAPAGINERVRSDAAQFGYICISSMKSTSYNDAIARYGHDIVWAGSHLSPVGFSVLTKPEIADINDFLRL